MNLPSRISKNIECSYIELGFILRTRGAVVVVTTITYQNVCTIPTSASAI